MSPYFPKPYRSFGGNIEVKLDLSNYATKSCFKNSTQIDTSNFVKLVLVPVDLSKLSVVVKNDVVQKTV